jgi:glycine cleavage system transcriptional repressor
MGKWVISGVGPDRTGIVAGITDVLFRHGCNIEESSMTILAEEFSWILIVSHPTPAPTEAVQEAFNQLEAQLGVTLFLRELAPHAPIASYPPEAEPIMISVCGHDRTGITFQVAHLLSDFKVNITDLNAQTIAGEDGPVYIMMIEAAVLPETDRTSLETSLQTLSKELGVEISVRDLEPLTL